MAAPVSGRPRLEVADIIRAHGEDFRRLHAPSAAQEAVLRKLAACRTAGLGGHVEECHACGYAHPSYNSCRDRHCPKCQRLAAADWLERRKETLLPVPYFHVVFTLPAELNALMLGNPRQMYGLLFEAAAGTLKTLAADPRHLGAEIGFTAVLHTWGQNLQFHPHLHCVVTGGGLSPDGQTWVTPKSRGKVRKNPFLFPVKVLGKVFRRKFLEGLERLRKAGTLAFGGSTMKMLKEASWKKFREDLARKDWVVYAKQPFAGPEQVFAYLSRYTHKVALSNHRLLLLKEGNVTFTLKTYAEGGKKGTLTLEASEFLRRFCLHVLPKGFTRIRHYGLLAGKNAAKKLAQARKTLAVAVPPLPTPILPGKNLLQDLTWDAKVLLLTGVDPLACPQCGTRLTRRRLKPGEVSSPPPPPSPAPVLPALVAWDTS